MQDRIDDVAVLENDEDSACQTDEHRGGGKLPEGGEAFQVRLAEGQARAALGECHWREWGERLAEFDAEWGALVAEEWLADVRKAAQAALEKRLAAVDGALDAAAGSGRGLLRRAEGVLAELHELFANRAANQAQGASQEIPAS